MRKHIFLVFIVLIIVMQALAMENDVLTISNIQDPAILRKDIFDITELLLDDKTSSQKRIELNNTLAPIYERLIKLVQIKKDGTPLNIELAMQEAKNFCYGVIDDITDTQEEENCFKRDSYFAYQAIIARLYEIHYKLTPEDEEIPKELEKKTLEKACILLRIKASLYKKKMHAQETDLLIKLQELEEHSNSLEKTQQSKASLDSELKKAKEDFKRIQESVPSNTTNIKLLDKVRRSRKKIDLLEKRNELLELRNTENKDIDKKLKKTQDKFQRIKTSLAYLRNDLQTIAKIPQDIIQIDPVKTKLTNT